MEAYASGAGPKNAAKKERAYVMVKKHLKPDEKKAAHAGSKIEEEEDKKKALHNPVHLELPLPLGPPEDGGGDSGESNKAVDGRRIKRGKKKKYRVGMEYLGYVAENPHSPLYEPVPCFDLGFMEAQERYVAGQLARREKRKHILKQLEEFGYADVEVDVPDFEQDRALRH